MIWDQPGTYLSGKNMCRLTPRKSILFLGRGSSERVFGGPLAFFRMGQRVNRGSTQSLPTPKLSGGRLRHFPPPAAHTGLRVGSRPGPQGTGLKKFCTEVLGCPTKVISLVTGVGVILPLGIAYLSWFNIQAWIQMATYRDVPPTSGK